MSEVKEKSPAVARKPKAILRPTIDMFLKCPRCQHPQHEYVYTLYDKPWIKCNECEQLSPSGAWKVIAAGNILR